MLNLTTLRRSFMAASLICGLAACNNDAKETPKEDSAKATDTASTMQMAPPPTAEFVPFNVMEITHTVKDYAKWKPAFDADSVNRQAAGLQNFVLGHVDGKPNEIVILLKMADADKAKAFAEDPRLKEVMSKAGVISKPNIETFHVIRDKEAAGHKWVEITHRVKDFDTWLKAYEAEGKEKRISEGLIDLALARGINDPNIVKVVLEYNDLKQAKASIFSEEKKKVMMNAGVLGVPKVDFYEGL